MRVERSGTGVPFVRCTGGNARPLSFSDAGMGGLGREGGAMAGVRRSVAERAPVAGLFYSDEATGQQDDFISR